MTRQKKAAEVRRLRDEHGLIWQDIADVMGISRTYAHALYNDPDGSKDKARKAQYGRLCVDCGKRTSGSDGRVGAPEACLACFNHRRRVAAVIRICRAIRRFHARYGRAPHAADFSPGQARARGHEWRARRFERDGDYPFTSEVRNVFGSWNAGVSAAGFEPTPLGEYPRRGGDDCPVVGSHLDLEREAA